MHRMDPRRRRAPRLLLPLLLAVLLALLHVSEARRLRSARLSPSASSSLLGIPANAKSSEDDGSSSGKDGDDDGKPAPTLLFTLQSESAFLQLGNLPTEVVSRGGGKGEETASETPGDFDRGTLTLRGVAPTAVWFSERPSRAAGALPTSALASEALDVEVDVDDDDEGDNEEEHQDSGDKARNNKNNNKKKRREWLGVPNVALTGTLDRRGGGASSPSSSSAAIEQQQQQEGEGEGEETVTAVLTVLGRPSYDEAARTLTADVRVIPMKASANPPRGPSSSSAAAGAAGATGTTEVTLPPPPHSPPEQIEQQQQRQPRSLSLTRAALLIDQLPMSEGYMGNNYGYANDCLSTMSPSCNPFAGTGYYRPGFVGWLGGQLGPGNVPKYPPGRGRQSPPSAPSSSSSSSSSPSSSNNNQSPSPPPPPPPPPTNSNNNGNNNGNSGQVYLMSQPYEPSKG